MDHVNLDKCMVTLFLIGMVHHDLAYLIKCAMQMVKDEYGFEIMYDKAWHGLKRTVEKVYCTWKDFMKRLPTYMLALQR